MAAFRVVKYSISALRQLLDEKAHKGSIVSNKAHAVYLDEYLQRLGTKTLLIEEEYVDKHYVEDYAGYYSRCFEDYKRKCARIHFFKSAFSEADFEGMLQAKVPDASLLQDCYLGFLVVKPLPQTVVGRTCLANYSDPGVDRVFPANQRYNVSLFGFPLHVDSLAFQEQDTDVAACATSALWSAFQATGRMFQHDIPSPVAITRAASTIVRLNNRTMPNHEGLTAEQMAEAIRSVGLEPHAIPVGRRIAASPHFTCDADLFRTAAHAYLRSGIPCLACGALVEVTSGKEIGLHAITLNGFRMGAGPSSPAAPILRATRINRLYAHDDAVGPFARLRFGSTNTPILTSWQDSSGGTDNVQFIPLILLVPTYHKMRVPFVRVRLDITQLDSLIEGTRQSGKMPSLTSHGEWDIYLGDAGRLKREMLSLPHTRFDKDILTGAFPKYTWTCDFYSGSDLKAKVFIDATDLLQGSHFINAVCYDDAFGSQLGTLQRELIANGLVSREAPITKAILDWFAYSYP